MWQTWTEQLDMGGAPLWMPMCYEAETAEEAVDKALAFFDVRYLQQGQRLTKVIVCPQRECLDFPVVPTTLPTHRRAVSYGHPEQPGLDDRGARVPVKFPGPNDY
jgi:hypothetical protein